MDELLLVKGVTQAVLYGEDTNNNGLLDPWEDDGDETLPDDDSDGELDRGLAAYVTVYSYEPNLAFDGEARLNLTSASEDELRQRLSEGMSEEMVEAVMSARQSGGSQGQGQGQGQGASGGGRGASGTSTMADFLQEVPALLQEENRSSLAHLLDVATTSDEEEVEGLVNVNTAPVEVLATIPGVTAEIAQAIDAMREEGRADFSSPAWLLDLESVNTELFLQLLPRVTTRTYQYTVDAVGVAGRRNVYRRLEVVLDGALTDVPPIYWRDVTSRGEPFDLDADAEGTL
jgi:DNA uptake protein ComE-like DNA-binding protein